MRLMIARTMRKMQVPAYSPAVEGVHWLEKRGVVWSLVKTMDIDMECDMLLLLEDEEESMSMLDMSWLLWSMVCNIVDGFRGFGGGSRGCASMGMRRAGLVV